MINNWQIMINRLTNWVEKIVIKALRKEFKFSKPKEFENPKEKILRPKDGMWPVLYRVDKQRNLPRRSPRKFQLKPIDPVERKKSLAGLNLKKI